ncbi:MAG: MlaD family protein [Acidobacteriota bacterium]
MSPTARVGVFMLVALVILGVFIIKIEEIPIGAKSGRIRVQATFPSVAGLDEKSAVRVAGVRVGIVEHIALDGNRALVTLALDPGVALHQGAFAEVSSLGMLGDKYIELDPGPLANPALPPGSVLSGGSPTSFDEALKTLNDVGSDIQAVTATLRKTLGGDEGQRRIDEILDNIRQLTADTRAMVAANRTQVGDTIENFRDFSAILKTELPRLAEKFGAFADRLDALVAENRGNLSEGIANIKDLSARFRTTADNLNAITDRIARGEGTVGKLINDEETVNNLNSTLKSVDSAVKSAKNTLLRVERFRLDVNLRAESLPGIEESRTAFGIDLHLTEKRFYRLELVDSPWGRDRTYTERLTTTYPDGRRETVLQERFKTSDASTVNAQVGYHLGATTLRAGLFESTGGVGVDRYLLENRLRLTLEAYDFGREEKPPHFRIEGRYFLTSNMFAFAGWDDPGWSKRSSALLGGGITWQDDDLKYMLGSLGSIGK